MLAVPLAAASAVRFGLALPSNSDTMLHFWGWEGKHSVVYFHIKRFLWMLGFEQAEGLITLNGAVGCCTTIPLYFFMRNITGSAAAGFFSALLFAVHPLVARFSVSDAHYSPMLFLWFSGLALLSDRSAGSAAVFSGLALLGLGASMRIEGLLYFFSSFLLLGVRRSWRSITGHRAAAAAGILLSAALVAAQYHGRIQWWHTEIHVFRSLPGGFPSAGAALGWIAGKFRLEMTGELWHGPEHATQAILVALQIAAVVAAAADRRWRWPLLGMLAALIPVVFISFSQIAWVDPTLTHRLVPPGALRCMIGGAALGWLLSRLEGGALKDAMAALLGVSILACFPLANMGILGERFEFNAEFELVKSLPPPEAREGGCTVLHMKMREDVALDNPQVIAPGYRFMDCGDPAACVKEAEKGGCVYYFRNAQCFFVMGATLKNKRDLRPANAKCNILEDALSLEAVKEATVNFYRTYTQYTPHDSLQRWGRIGIYKVTGVRPRR
jgi:hypothetical protein